MEDVIKLYWDLRATSEANGDEIAEKFSVKPHEEPVAFFAMVFNSITLTLELLDHYHQIWRYPGHVLNTRNKMSQGNLKQFGLLVQWLLNEAKAWIEIATPFS